MNANDLVVMNTAAATATAEDISRLFALMAIVADPSASRARLKKIEVAEKSLREVINQATRDTAELSTARETQTAAQANERKALDVELAEKRAAFERECTERRVALDAREVAAAAREQQTRADAEAAATLRGELERVRASINSLAS